MQEKPEGSLHTLCKPSTECCCCNFMQKGAGKELHGTNKKITYFISALKIKNSFSKKVKLHAPNAQHKKLFHMCRTRQVQRKDGTSMFEELLVSIYRSLEKMKENKCKPRFNNETSTKADSLFNLLLTLFLLSHQLSLEISQINSCQ